MIAVKPESLDISELQQRYPTLKAESFANRYFRSIHGYNALMMSAEFYNRFSDFEYILIYQLDAWIFHDRLDDWMARGYDYAGAPWIPNPKYRTPFYRFTNALKRTWCDITGQYNSQNRYYKVGNGGFSLRKVASHREAVRQLKNEVGEYLSHAGEHLYNEDMFFSVEVNRHGLGFRYPDWLEALDFSFDTYPAECLELNGRRLPMGCHAWSKKKMWSFWKEVISLG